MTVPGSANPLLLRSAAPAGYQIQRSLRFNSSDSAYLSRTFSSPTNNIKWTWCGWVKRSKLSTDYRTLFNGNSISTNYASIEFSDTDNIRVYNRPSSAGGVTAIRTTSAVFRDTSAWYHIMVVWDSANATAADRLILYVNGTRVTAFSSSTDPTSSEASVINSAIDHGIGRQANYNGYYFDGYLADVFFIDGQALTPSSFTEVSATTGQLIPKAYTGSYGTNGFRLDFSDNSDTTATTLGKDRAGSNNWTPSGLSVAAGAGNDSLTDSPTSYGTDTGAGGEVRGNYATLNPLTPAAGGTLSDGNLAFTGYSTPQGPYQIMTAVWGGRTSAIAVSSGKWYFEVTPTANAGNGVVVGVSTTPTTDQLGSTSTSYGYLNTTGERINSNSGSSYGATWSNNDVIGCALDIDGGTVTFYKNGVSQGVAYSSLSTSTWFLGVSCRGSTTTAYANFGQRPFAYTAPSGFKALCDQNLPAPTIARPSTVMDVKLYTGNGSTQTISGLGFSPDLVWIKARGAAAAHNLYDIIRGTSKPLYSNLTNAEATNPSNYGVSAFNSDGFSVSDITDGNYSVNGAPGGAFSGAGAPYVAWTWDAGSSTVTNTQGSITSSCRTNQSSGFSIVSYAGGQGSNFTVGHGLNVQPSFVITKARNANDSWGVYYTNNGVNTNWISLNSTAAQGPNNGPLAGGAFMVVNSTTLQIASTSFANGGSSMIAYCFAPVAGYSSFGTYTGNGSTDGPFVYTGFRPRFILTKATNSALDWNIFDAARDPYNSVNKVLFPNLSNAESDYIAYTPFDFLSNGFKLRTNIVWNASSTTYIYAAFAENPFQYARAR